MTTNTSSIVVYIVSDSIGETGEFVVRAAVSQFGIHQCELRRIPHVHDTETILDTVNRAKQHTAMIAFTIVLPELRDYLVRAAQSAGVIAVDVMGPMVEAIETVIGQPPMRKAGLVHQLNDDYFRRVAAIEFAVKYDDGRDPRGLSRADIVLIGVSRTSKTPLSMYLALQRYLVANVPLVPEASPPDELFHPTNKRKVIGLTIRKDQLNLIRQERLRSLGLPGDANYARPERIDEELNYAHAIMERLRCPVIEVSDKAVEETAAMILSHIDGDFGGGTT